MDKELLLQRLSEIKNNMYDGEQGLRKAQYQMMNLLNDIRGLTGKTREVLIDTLKATICLGGIGSVHSDYGPLADKFFNGLIERGYTIRERGWEREP